MVKITGVVKAGLAVEYCSFFLLERLEFNCLLFRQICFWIVCDKKGHMDVKLIVAQWDYVLKSRAGQTSIVSDQTVTS